jgi:hypothetical protein
MHCSSSRWGRDCPSSSFFGFNERQLFPVGLLVGGILSGKLKILEYPIEIAEIEKAESQTIRYLAVLLITTENPLIFADRILDDIILHRLGTEILVNSQPGAAIAASIQIISENRPAIWASSD